MELADMLALEPSAARRASSILAKVTIKWVGGQVLKSLGRNPKERELKSHPTLQNGFWASAVIAPVWKTGEHGSALWKATIIF